MDSTAINPTAIVAYLALFGSVAFVFVLAALGIGRFLRAQDPTPGKLGIYECGETPIGPGFIQFDLRFYVVALLFIIFEVEVAFFFPWGTVFGKVAQLRDPRVQMVESDAETIALSTHAERTLQGLGVASPSLPEPTSGVQANDQQLRRSARDLAVMAMVDIAVFFGVLLLGFAYLWNRGDLNWVRASSGPAVDEEVRELGREAVVGDQALAGAIEQDQ